MVARILVVDDTPSIRLLIRTNLELAGHEVLEAGNGAECLITLHQEHVDAMTIDAVMPGCDGFAIIAKLRESEMTRDLPILMVTTRASARDEARGFAAGANAYLTKPFDPEELITLVEGLLQRANVMRDRLDG